MEEVCVGRAGSHLPEFGKLGNSTWEFRKLLRLVGWGVIPTMVGRVVTPQPPPGPFFFIAV